LIDSVGFNVPLNTL